MPIKCVPDRLGEPYEHCCFCFKPARYWYKAKDVPVCSKCAPAYSPEEVPTKERWCEMVAERYPTTYGGKKKSRKPTISVLVEVHDG